MQSVISKRFRGWRLLGLITAFVASLASPMTARAQMWHVQAGAQSQDKGSQVLAFLPNEIWIHAGDTITWTIASDEPHIVAFLAPGQVRPPFVVGCPGTAPNGSDESGSNCVNSGLLANGQSYSVTFHKPGNYKLVCLLHTNMTAVVHVFDPSQELPHNQNFYDAEAADEQNELLSAAGHTRDQDEDHAPHGVVAGTGEIAATAGGSETLSVLRFMQPTKVVHVGETVEWTNSDPVTAHTITFGTEPANPIPPSANVTVDVDGARHATVNSPTDNVHSGFISAAPQDEIGLPQLPLSFTRFRVTFTKPGLFDYKCSLHDGLGMVGQVIVLP